MQTFVLGLRYFFIDLLWGVLRFPIWWYTGGAIFVGTWAFNTVFGYTKMLAVGVWIKNIFVPMFGFYDWQSRLISVFMRLANIIGRSIAVAILSVLIACLFVIYLLLPPLTLAGFLYNL